jgi:hypothetical protein
VIADVFRATTFLNAILNVVLLGAKEKMVRTNARRVVAIMKNAEIIGNRPMMNKPRGTMSADGSILVGHNEPTPIERAVTGRIFAASPKPATVSFLDMLPEKF